MLLLLVIVVVVVRDRRRRGSESSLEFGEKTLPERRRQKVRTQHGFVVLFVIVVVPFDGCVRVVRLAVLTDRTALKTINNAELLAGIVLSLRYGVPIGKEKEKK